MRQSEAIIVPQPDFPVREVVERQKVCQVLRNVVYKDCWICDPVIKFRHMNCVKFENCVIDDLDTGKMCPEESHFNAHEDGRLIGYRTRRSVYMDPNWAYEVGRVYEAEIFSTSQYEVCHPGLHVYTQKHSPDHITVLFDLEDLHSVCGAHRVRKFEVIE